MTMSAGSVGGDLGVQCRILRGDARAGEPLQTFGASMMTSGRGNPRCWIIDNREANGHLPLVDLARMVSLARSHPEHFANVSLAWVSNMPLSGCLKAMVKDLPFEFREFDDMLEAYTWFMVERH